MPVVAEDPKTNEPSRLSRRMRVFRCYVSHYEEGGYIAECIDLDIAARGESAYKAFQSLTEAITGYLAVAFRGDTEGLVPRRSPWRSRLRYHLFALRAALGLFTDRDFLVSDYAFEGLLS